MKISDRGVSNNNAGEPVKKANRIEWVDVAKGVVMFCVIITHTGYTYPFWGSLSIPRMACLFIISGYLFINPAKEIDYRQKFLNICTSILLPYLLYWVLSYSVEQILAGNFNFLGSLISNILEGRKLWFISALFVAEIFIVTYLYLCNLISNNRIHYYILPIVCLLIYNILPDGGVSNIWYLKQGFLSAAYISLGIVCKLHSQRFIESLKNNYIGIAAIIIFILFFIVDYYVIKIEGHFVHGISNLPYAVIESIFAGYAILFTCTKIKFLPVIYPILVFVGQNSILFYFFQNQALKIPKYLGSYFSIASPSWWYSIVSALVVVAILYFPILFVQRFMPAMAGKYKIILNKNK